MAGKNFLSSAIFSTNQLLQIHLEQISFRRSECFPRDTLRQRQRGTS